MSEQKFVTAYDIASLTAGCRKRYTSHSHAWWAWLLCIVTLNSVISLYVILLKSMAVMAVAADYCTGSEGRGHWDN